MNDVTMNSIQGFQAQLLLLKYNNVLQSHYNDYRILGAYRLLQPNAFQQVVDNLSYFSYNTISLQQIQFNSTIILVSTSFNRISKFINHFKLNGLFITLNGGTTLSKQQNKKVIIQYFKSIFFLNAKRCYFCNYLNLFIFYLLLSIFKQIQFNNLEALLKIQAESKISQTKNLFKSKYNNLVSSSRINIFIRNSQCTLIHYCILQILTLIHLFKYSIALLPICGLFIISIKSLQLLSIIYSHIHYQQYGSNLLRCENLIFCCQSQTLLHLQNFILQIYYLFEFIVYPKYNLWYSLSYYLIYLIKCKPLKSPYEGSKLKYREFLFLIITRSFLIYFFELSYDTCLLFGWMHIGLISLIFILLQKALKQLTKQKLIRLYNHDCQIKILMILLCNYHQFCFEKAYQQQIIPLVYKIKFGKLIQYTF
ncbi:unnamed protein product [Paramecium octaurelia]|uniref:Transmembrane protein n=1 Tax=Paramecium octaurelia TaxID=43137 RepID=A0A8S1RYN2_PAROT|nr:unnamed protein product [Paramecium octaurelia]